MLQVEFVSDKIKDGLAEYHEQYECDKDNADPIGPASAVSLCPNGELIKHRPYWQGTGYNDTEDFE